MSFYKRKMDNTSMELVRCFSVNLNENEDYRCKNPAHYNDYLLYQALIDEKQGLGVTYLYVDYDDQTGEESIIGYMTLRTNALIKDDLGSNQMHGYPALEIAELAVSEKYAGKGFGREMVMDAIHIANSINNVCSIKYVVLCADPSAESFYKQSDLGFMKINDAYESVPREQANQECIPLYLKLR